MRVLKTVKELSSFRDTIQKGKNVALVPTMGNLHDGHISLVKKAKQDNDVICVSIFVNPTQFGPNEDFNKYPRTFDEDLEKLSKVDCDVVFVPSVSEMYPNGVDNVFVTERSRSKGLCGKYRPGHFDGVLTVVLKLLNICKPNKAYFGMKDYQQLVLIKEMLRSLNMDIEVIPCSLVRESDGLAMSSRNSYLSKEDRKKALKINYSINKINELFISGVTNVEQLKRLGLENLMPEINVQYIDIVDKDTLTTVKNAKKGDIVAISGFCGNVRLIDNITL